MLRLHAASSSYACRAPHAVRAAPSSVCAVCAVQLRADEVCDSMSSQHPSAALHGDISQGMRDRSLQQFR